MNIRIMCSCGTKFAFEVEPVDGRMPFAINCPSCGIDGTAFANHYISQALANPGTEALVVVPVTDDEPEPNAAVAPAIEPEPAPRARLAVQPRENAVASPAEAIPTVESEAPAAAAPHRLSVKRPVAEEAAVGGAEPPGRAAEPMPLNLDAEREKRMAEIQAARAREKQFWSKVAWAARGVVMFVLLLLGAYFWYYFSGSKPKEFYTVTLQGDEYSARSRLIGPHELVVLDSAGVTLHDLKSGQSVWTTALTGSEGASGGGGRFGYRGSNHADLHVTDSDIWALSQNRLFQLDRASGDQKKSIALAGSVLQFAPSSRDILIVSSSGEQRRSVMRVDLATGASTVQAVELPAAQQTSATAQFGAPRLPTQGNLLAEELELHGKLQLAKLRTELLAAGENVARVEVRLVTPKVVSVKVMKDSGESRLDGKVTAAANPMAIAEDLMNEQKRASGDMYREVDESTYEVTLTRVLAKGAATWRGALTGRPEFFPLKSVDVLAGQNELYLFDKSNKLLKQHKLKYPISEEFASPFGRPAEAPCLEDDGLVFFFDQGTVTAFAAATGELRWTLTTVWTSRVQPDGQGHLFISTTSAGPDSIQYSEQVNLTSRPSAVLMKVEAQTGKVLWSRNDAGQACHLAGKFLYGTRRRGGAALSPFAPSSEASLTISRLKPRNGKRTWDYPCKPAPDYFEFQDNRILLQNDNEVRVLKYLAIF